MRSNVVRVLIGVALMAAAIVLLVVLKGTDNGTDGGSEEPAGKTSVEPASKRGEESAGKKERAPAVPTIVIENGKPVGGVAELTYDAGDQVRFKVASDVTDEIHLHGYDISKEVEAGGSVSFDFPATIEGVFEGELEDRGEQILELRVNP